MTTVPTHRSRDWQLPNGRAAISQARKAVHNALQEWGLGHTAGEVADHLTQLMNQLNATSRGPFDLRLELRQSARLLLGEIRRRSPAPPDSGGESGHGIVAVTYGKRTTRDGARWYTHAFSWSPPEETAGAH
ncbi:hypothetical protein SMC26_15820 [Actinomadura fulvescens]|uniref:Uncharacterized protein n=1 Tax=Actinomadura fulvescens TaxID=46160 RepID=A0ABN3QW64_9ACTN